MTSEREDGGDRLDLSPLDPAGDAEALERLVQRVRTAATGELLRRQRGPRLEDLLVALRRPILASFGVVALLSIVVLVTVRRPETTRQDVVSAALGVPSAWADWTVASRQPSVEDLLGDRGRNR